MVTNASRASAVRVQPEIIEKKAPSSAKPKRMVLGSAICAANIFGWSLIALALLGLPQMRVLTGRLAEGFGLLTSVALALAGVVWLVGVRMFLRFFDWYLSNN
jgi:hypothetical protein